LNLLYVDWYLNLDAGKKVEKTNCIKIPYTLTIKYSFNEIKLTISNDSILVFFYKVTGVNMRKQ